jgi:RimJ/RimL family protein N-acetyltransferase
VRLVDSSYSLSDGNLTIRTLSADDLEMHVGAVDDEQIDWLWEPGQREPWEAMTPEQRRQHQRRFLDESERSFGPGPKWRFAVDTQTATYVAYLDCDLANPHVPQGQANISYVAHPAYRGLGYVSGGVRLVLRFLSECTTATEAHIIVDPRNVGSLRVAHAVGALEVGSFTNELGNQMIRHLADVPRK